MGKAYFQIYLAVILHVQLSGENKENIFFFKYVWKITIVNACPCDISMRPIVTSTYNFTSLCPDEYPDVAIHNLSTLHLHSS